MSFETTTVILDTSDRSVSLDDLEPARHLLRGIGVGALISFVLAVGVYVLI